MAGRDTAGEDPLRTRVATALDFLGRVDRRNLRMLPNALSILARPSLEDWYYNRDLVARELPRELLRLLVDPGEMNAFQRHCPVAGYVSTPADGILAGFTERGRMSTLLCPHTGYTQQLPYYETGGTHLKGARPREGAFFGVECRGDERVTWLWEPSFAHRLSSGPGIGELSFTYEPRSGGPVEASERASVPPGTETVVRELTVENTGERPVDRVVYYLQANANDRQQYVPGITSPNRVVAAEEAVTWRDKRSERRIRLAGEDPVAATGVVTGPLIDAFDDVRPVGDGRHVGGFLSFDVDLAPGEETTVTVSTTWRGGDAAADGGRAADGYGGGPSNETGDQRWSEWLAGVPVDQVPDRFADQYERSVEGLVKLFDPTSGSLSAAPNFQPTYYPSWPRDGAFVAIALAEAGIEGPATAYLGEFLPSVQGADGGFEQCYTSDGSAAGIIPRENDQQGIYVHAVRAVHETTGDDAFLRAAWPTVVDALEYTVTAIADNGLLRATPDFAEMPSDARQSLWTNAFAYRGLLDGATLAEHLGADGERYRRAARHVGDALDRACFAGREEFATELTIRGPERDENVAYSAAVHPTGWASDYGHTAALLDGFAATHHDGEEYWLPREFTYAASLYAADREAEADRILERLQTERLPGGTLAEEVDVHGDHNYAALAWANAAFVHALHVREGIAADVV